MNSELASFAARLRGRIAAVAGEVRRLAAETRNSKPETRNPVGASSRRLLPDGEFNALALELFALQFAHNAAYRCLCEARGVKPSSVAHWTQIPAVPAAAFKELELSCVPASERTAVFHSSGTTAQKPSRHFHCAESLALYETSLWASFEPHMFGALPMADGRLVMLTPPPAAAPNSSLVHMFETVRRNCAALGADYFGATDATGAWTLNLGGVEAALREAVAVNLPVIVLGTAFNFVHLLDWLTERNLRLELPPGSVVLETGGYKGRSRELAKANLHRFITERLGVAASCIICEYGMSELSSQAYDHAARNTRPATRRFDFPPWVRVQIISPETGREVNAGERGLLRLHDLANAFSVAPIQTEDLAIRREDGFELLGRAGAAEPRGCSLMAA